MTRKNVLIADDDRDLVRVLSLRTKGLGLSVSERAPVSAGDGPNPYTDRGAASLSPSVARHGDHHPAPPRGLSRLCELISR